MPDVTTILSIRIPRIRATVSTDVSTGLNKDVPTVRATNAQAAKDLNTGYLVAAAL